MHYLKTRLHSHRYARRAILPLLLMLYGLQAQAQPNWPPTTPTIADQYGSGINSTEWVNTDMYNYYSGTSTTSPYPYTITVWDYWDAGASKWKVGIFVFNPVNGAVDIDAIDDAKHPDVVMADGGSTTDLKAAVVYEKTTTGGGIGLSYFNVTVSGGTASIGTITSATASSASSAANPHIDAAPNSTATTWSLTQIDDYVFTWSELNGGNMEVKMQTGTLSAGPSTGTPTAIDLGTKPDIAYVFEPTSGSYIAHFTYVDGNNLKQATYNLGTTALSTQILESSVTVTAPPRIEAMNVQDATATTKWQVVAEIAGITYSEIHGYREVSGSPMSLINYSTLAVIPPNVNPLTTRDGYGPAVAAGNGPDTYGLPTDYGNEKYTMGWYINGADYEAINALHNTTVAATTGYATINTNTAPAALFATLGYCPLALTNGSNDGAGLYSAYMGDDGSGNASLMVKYSGNSFSFKPTSLLHMARGTWMVYPNPATDYLSLSGKGTAKYSITDMAGRVLLTGEVTDAAQLNISNVPKGMYLVQLKTGTETETVKLVKQ